MLKDEVLHALALFKKENGVSDCRLGVAGSVARGEETPYSDIDVVVDKNCISIDEIEKIKYFMSTRFHRDTDVLCIGLLKEDDDEMDAFAISCGLPVNEFSVYKTVSKDMVWGE